MSDISGILKYKLRMRKVVLENQDKHVENQEYEQLSKNQESPSKIRRLSRSERRKSVAN